jgi:hypothetical protein
MRVMAVIDQREVVEKILRHLDLWNGTPPLAPARVPPDADAGPWTREPFDDVVSMPDNENVLACGRHRHTVARSEHGEKAIHPSALTEETAG